MAYELSEILLDEVSLVDVPASPGAQVVIFKRGDPPPDGEDHHAHQGAGDGAFFVAASAAPNPSTEEDMPETRDLDELVAAVEAAEAKTAELTKALETKDAELAKAKADLEAAVAKAKEPPPEPEKKDDDVLKSLPEPVRKQLDDMAKRLEVAEAIAKKAAEDKELTEFVAKAKGFAALPVKAEEFGALLHRVTKNSATAEDVAELDRVLRAADAALTKGSPFKPVGKQGGTVNGTSAEDQLNELAKAKAAKDGISIAKAYDAVLRERPDLYEDYLAEKSA